MELEDMAHNRVMSFLASQKTRLEEDVILWANKYEEDLESSSKELESLKSKRAADSDEFEKLVVEYERIEKIIEENKVLRAIQDEEDRKLRKKERAAIKIQSWWRVLVKKRADSSASNKKGKGKGKAGSGKGKKK